MRRRNRKKAKQAPKAINGEDKCATKWCRNRKAEKKTYYRSASGAVIVYTGYLNHCWKCRARMLKERRPWTYVLNMLRASAKKRKLPFTLTVESFRAWCAQTGYLEKRGNKPEDMTVDRIDWNEGYHIWNIQMMTHAKNSEQGGDNTRRDERGAADTDDLAEAGEPVAEDQPF